MRQVEVVNDALYDLFNEKCSGGIGCIVYVFDNCEDGGGTGFNSQNCDAGDAMTAIMRIANEFGIDLHGLAATME